jgi:hypothetical protein
MVDMVAIHHVLPVVSNRHQRGVVAAVSRNRTSGKD